MALVALAPAQEVFPSNTYIRTCISDIECSAINSSSHVFYDEARSDFYIKIDFSLFRTGVDSVDFWIEDLAGTNYYFKASVAPQDLPNLSDYNPKVLHLTGEAFMNGVWRDETMDVTVFRAQSDLLGSDSGRRDYHDLRVNLSFSIQPKNFNIHKLPQGLSSTIFVGIGSGPINLLKPGLESHLGEAFNRVD